MGKSKAELIGLVLFSLLTAGIGQALIITSAPSPSYQAIVPQDVLTRFIRPAVFHFSTIEGLLASSLRLAWPLCAE